MTVRLGTVGCELLEQRNWTTDAGAEWCLWSLCRFLLIVCRAFTLALFRMLRWCLLVV